MATETRPGVERLRNQYDRAKSAAKEHRFAYAMFVPTLVFLLAILWIPFFRGVVMSFYRWPLVGEPEFVGLGNWTHLFTWDPFWTSAFATIIYGLSTAAIQLVIAIVAALAVANMSSKFKGLFSAIYMVPYAMPQIITGAIWLYLLEVNFGPFWTFFVDTLGLLSEPLYWGTNGDQALAVIIGVAGWTFWPFMFLLIIAAREAIPDTHYEAGKMYGASRWQLFRQVTLPQIRSAIIVALALRIIWNMVKVAQPYQLTEGGPGYDTSILGILLYRFAFVQQDMGLAFTVGLILMAITIAAAFVFIREFQKQSGTGGGAF
jgi:ABC-type sugar transport system permease subunit